MWTPATTIHEEMPLRNRTITKEATSNKVMVEVKVTPSRATEDTHNKDTVDIHNRAMVAIPHNRDTAAILSKDMGVTHHRATSSTHSSRTEERVVWEAWVPEQVWRWVRVPAFWEVWLSVALLNMASKMLIRRGTWMVLMQTMVEETLVEETSNHTAVFSERYRGDGYSVSEATG